jgi:hypothetical protein
MFCFGDKLLISSKCIILYVCNLLYHVLRAERKIKEYVMCFP